MLFEVLIFLPIIKTYSLQTNVGTTKVIFTDAYDFYKKFIKFPSFVIVLFFSLVSHWEVEEEKINHNHLQQLKNTIFIVKV